MGKIKLVSWDVYGTLIASGNIEISDVEELEHLRTRPGALEALLEIKSREIIQCTCSDGHLDNLKQDMEEAGITWIDFFNDLYKMNPWEPKDFSVIIKDYKIEPENLLVIGDNYIIDLAHAKSQGCQTLWVPELNPYKKNPLNVKQIQELLDLE